MVSCVISCQPNEILLQGTAFHQSPPPNHLLLGIKTTRNSRPTATGLSPGILTSDMHREGCFLAQNCRFKLLTTKMPTFLDLWNTIQTGIPRNHRLPVRILIFVNNNEGLWSSPGKKKEASKREEEVRRADKQRENSSQNLSADIKEVNNSLSFLWDFVKKNIYLGFCLGTTKNPQQSRNISSFHFFISWKHLKNYAHTLLIRKNSRDSFVHL